MAPKHHLPPPPLAVSRLRPRPLAPARHPPPSPWPRQQQARDNGEQGQGDELQHELQGEEEVHCQGHEQHEGRHICVQDAKVVADELMPKAGMNHISNASTCRRPAGSSKVRVVPSRYSLIPGASLGAATQERRRKESLPESTGGAGQREEINAMPTEPVDVDLSSESLDKVAELLLRIRTMQPPDETPRDLGCAKLAADLVGKRSFVAAAAGDGSAISSYQARVLKAEAPEEALSDEAAV